MTESAVVSGTLWTEVYRPTSLEDVALAPETRAVLQSYLEAGEIPHVMFLGPPGSGKTTVARILLKALDCSVLTLNASAERGIDTVRAKIGTFVTAITLSRFNVVFLDEADAMTSDAQTALRNLMESYSDRARFILTANYGHRIIGPLQSRCQVLALTPPPMKERFRILSRVLSAEGIAAQPLTIASYAEKYGDLRKMLWAAQKAFLGAGRTDLPTANTSGPTTGTEMFALLLKKDWRSFRFLTTNGEFDPQQGLKDLFWAVPDDHTRAGFLRHVFGRGVHESSFTPDPVVLFLGVVAEAMEGI